jgi:hypothetical protein
METPSKQAPASFTLELTRFGFSLVLAAPAVIASVTSTPVRAG